MLGGGRIDFLPHDKVDPERNVNGSRLDGVDLMEVSVSSTFHM